MCVCLCIVFLAVFPFWQGGFEIFGVFENSNRSASSGRVVLSRVFLGCMGDFWMPMGRNCVCSNVASPGCLRLAVNRWK